MYGTSIEVLCPRAMMASGNYGGEIWQAETIPTPPSVTVVTSATWRHEMPWIQHVLNTLRKSGPHRASSSTLS